MNNDDIILQLRKWLDKRGNSPAKLAIKLGYKTSNTIVMWLLRDRIPDWQIERVKKIIFTKGPADE